MSLDESLEKLNIKLYPALGYESTTAKLISFMPFPVKGIPVVELVVNCNKE